MELFVKGREVFFSYPDGTLKPTSIRIPIGLTTGREIQAYLDALMSNVTGKVSDSTIEKLPEAMQ